MPDFEVEEGDMLYLRLVLPIYLKKELKLQETELLAQRITAAQIFAAVTRKMNKGKEFVRILKGNFVLDMFVLKKKN